ncbi:MAG TPA: hypothetical protein P5191_01395 [Ruminococcus sp.]|nr:hypothetical protein [Ruminococcus sp.]
MHKKLDLGLKLGLAGNILFLLFGFFTFIYYKLAYKGTAQSKLLLLERVEYFLLFLGFAMFFAAAYFITISVRMRLKLKLAMWLYGAMEAFLMYCELHSYQTMSFYHPYSLTLAIGHALISAAICFLFLDFDPYKKPFEILIIVTIGIILAGMMGNIFEIRLYFSILFNAVALTVLFAGIIYMLNKEIIEIDCHGDKARVAEYRGFFDGDDPEEKKTDAQKASEKNSESNEENKDE